LQQQVEATLKLQQRSSLPDEIDLLATRLHEALLGQRAQIESTAASLSRMRRSQAVDVEELLDELAALLDTSHALRDRMHEAVLSILASEDRLEQIEQPLLVDALTGLLNRTGMEMLVRRWWREDTQRRRPVSMALLDIDRQASVNRSQGGRGGDGLLAAVGQLIDQTMRCRRGFDLAARFSGQQILLFLGDTTPHNATCAAERFRQAVAQCTFLRHGQPVELSLTAAVVGVMPEDDMHSLVRRLHRTLRRAKQAGRNATWLEDNGRHFPVPAMDYQLPVRTIEIDLESQSGAP
jgi:diguanylate cyclase (GGDEF)-like protein